MAGAGVRWKNQSRLEMQPHRRGVAGWSFLGRYNHTRAGKQLTAHAHPASMEFCHLVRGRQTYEVGGERFRMHGGDLFVSFPDEVHSSASTPQEKGVLYWLILEIPPKAGSMLQLPEREGRALRRSLLGLHPRLFTGNLRITRLLDGMMETLLAPATSLTPIRLRTALLDFLLEVIACSGHLPQREPGRLDRLAAYVHANLDRPLTVPELAGEADLSVPQFQARFKQEFGVPPGEYVMRAKVHQAAGWLAEGGRTVTEIAFALGFPSSQYFATVFKRYTGKTPSAYAAQA